MDGKFDGNDLNNKRVYIITRTHERELEFNNCYESLLSQTVKPNWLIISDSENNYLNKNFDISTKIIKVKPGRKKWWIRHHNFTNCYFNEALPLIPNGHFVFFLDDDDKLITKTWVEEVINKNSNVLIGKFQLGPNHKNKIIGEVIKRGEVGGSCYAIKSEIAKQFTWPNRGGGDFIYLKKILKQYTPNFTDTIIGGVQNNLSRSWKKRK